MRKDGFFITFEGPEGCGKSTHSKLLVNFLKEKGFNVKLTREPGGTSIGKQIREILLDVDNKNLTPMAEFFLLLADRNQNVTENIKPFLSKGYIVISDRYIDSSIAYQHGGRNIDYNLVKKLNKIATENLKPDITFILINDDIEKALENAKKESRVIDRFEKESILFHKKILRLYYKLEKEEKNRVILLNILENIEDTQNKIRDIIVKRLKKRGLL